MGWKGESRRHSLARKGVKTSIDQGRRFDVSNFVARGNESWKPDYLEKWEYASNYIGEDYSDYYVVYGRSRDSDLLTQSNWDQLEEEFDGKEGVEIIRSGHWAGGWVETILIHEDAEDMLMKADDFAKQLSEYPVLDEEDFTNKEYESTIENIQSQQSMDDETAREVFSWLWDHDQGEVEAMDGGGGYPSKEAIDKAIEDLSKKGRVVGEPFEWIEEKYGKEAVSHFKKNLSESEWDEIKQEDSDWRSDVTKEIYKKEIDRFKLSQFDQSQTKLQVARGLKDHRMRKETVIVPEGYKAFNRHTFTKSEADAYNRYSKQINKEHSPDVKEFLRDRRAEFFKMTIGVN